MIVRPTPRSTVDLNILCCYYYWPKEGHAHLFSSSSPIDCCDHQRRRSSNSWNARDRWISLSDRWSMIYLIPPHRKITSNDDAMAATKQQQHRRLKVAPSSLLMAATFSAIAWQIILVTVVFVPPIQSAATLIGDHICYRNERWVE